MKIFIIVLLGSLWSISTFSQKIEETKYYENHPEIAGEVLINKLTKEVKGQKAYTTFDISVSSSGNYYIFFWLCPSKLTDGSFSKYEVMVNGENIGKISPTIGDWQSITLEDEKNVYLNKGKNTISIIGELEDFPSVDILRMSTNKEKAKLSNNAYMDYKREILLKSRQRAEENLRLYSERDTLNFNKGSNRTSFPLTSQNDPPYDADFVIGIGFCYTFYKTVYFTQGQNITLSTTGVDNYEHVLEFFNRNTPNTYSWVNKSNSLCQSQLNIDIPVSGYYTVKVRSYENASSGLCNLNINNVYSYDSIPIFSTGIRGEKGTQNIYNSFTCYNNGDPILWVEEGMAPGLITAFNDDYISSSSDYSWGSNSRVKKQYTSGYNAILLTAYSSYNPTNKCDIYTNCISDYTNVSDNILQSAPSTLYTLNDYNCISWSGGIYTHFIWPPNEFVNEGLSDLESFDRFYSMERYPGCSTFTRVGANANNCAVELWAIVNPDGSRDYTHASVRKSADINRHGFDWESKLGHTNRIYHPRNIVPVSNYGQIVEHYLRTDPGPGSGSLEEAIANGAAVIENVQFTNEEVDLIENYIDRIAPSIMFHFNSLYEKWQEIWNTTVLSNPDQIADCDEYKELLDCCLGEENLKYAVFKMLGNGSISAVCLVKDLTLQDNMDLLEKVWNDNKQRKYTEKGAQIIRSIYSNAMLYVKEYLKQQNGNLKRLKNENCLTGIFYSNSDEFSVSTKDECISLRFSNNQSARIHADIIDVSGNIIGVFVRDNNLPPNTYLYRCKVGKGNYLVRYIVNGNVNVKKIVVK